MSATTIDAPAKVNLGLAVLARRGDGYHQIDTLLAALELHDTLDVALRGPGVTLEVDAPSGPGFSGGIPSDERNLAWRAAEAFFAATGAPGGAALRLVKRTPVAAGLGGGSSDAAATLVALARLHRERAVDLAALAAEIGSDVPFFVAALTGAGSAARARGRGERLDPVALPPRAVVLVHPGVPVSAGDAYAALQNFSARPDWSRIVAALEAGEAPRWTNALQPGVMLAHPEVRRAFTALRADPELGGALMSGSGSSCFALAPDDASARRAADRLASEHPDWWVCATRLRGG